jgi:hypothetical protein
MTDPAGRHKPAGSAVDYALVSLLTIGLVALLLVFFRDQVATVLAWLTSLIG